MINKVLLFGTVGDHVFEEATNGGKRVINFSIKQENPYTDKQTKETKIFKSYFNVSMFSEDAQAVPGDSVMLEGKLNNKKNEKTGKYDLSVIAYKLDVIKRDNGIPPVVSEYKNQDIPF